MSQPSLPFEIEWLNDQERHHAGLLLTGFIKLCKARGHPLTVLSIERIKHIIITDAQANRLETRLTSMLNRPGERIPGAFINAVTTARDRHARAIEAFEIAYPDTAAAARPKESESARESKPVPGAGHTRNAVEDEAPGHGDIIPMRRQQQPGKMDETRTPEGKPHGEQASGVNAKPLPKREPAVSATARDTVPDVNPFRTANPLHPKGIPEEEPEIAALVC